MTTGEERRAAWLARRAELQEALRAGIESDPEGVEGDFTHPLYTAIDDHYEQRSRWDGVILELADLRTEIQRIRAESVRGAVSVNDEEIKP